MREWIQHQLDRRPWWLNLLLLFCAYMVLIYVPRDLFLKPVAIDEEVWAAPMGASIAVVVWNLLYKEGESRYGFAGVGGVVFGWVSWVLWRARGVFQPPERSPRETDPVSRI